VRRKTLAQSISHSFDQDCLLCGQEVERIRQEKSDIDAELRHLGGSPGAAASSANYLYERRSVTYS